MNTLNTGDLAGQYHAEAVRQMIKISEQPSLGAPGILGPETPLPAHRLLYELWYGWHVRNMASEIVSQQTAGLLDLLGFGQVATDTKLTLPRCKYNLNLCLDAETRFVHAITAHSFFERHVSQPLVTVFHDLEARPLFLQKSFAPTALSLTALDIDGVNVPAGTILAVKSEDDRDLLSGVYKRSTLSGSVRYQAYPVNPDDQSVGLAPLRVSAWAHPDRLQRAFFGVSFNDGLSRNAQPIEFDTARSECMERHDINDFQSAAIRILKKCGIVPPIQSGVSD